jgi:hypothetical protein
LKEHFAEPLRAQAQAATIEEVDDEDDGGDTREPRGRILEPF